MIYQKEKALIERRNRLRVKNIDIANVIQKNPNTVGAKLCGYCPISTEERRKINEYFDRIERENAVTD
jgi:cyanate lyase